MVFGFINDYFRERRYVSMVDSKTRLTEQLFDDQTSKPQALDIVLAEVDENDFPFDYSRDVDGKELEKKPCLLHMERTGFGHFNIVSPAIQEVNFEGDRIRIQLGKNKAYDEVLIKSNDSQLISKLKQYKKNPNL